MSTSTLTDLNTLTNNAFPQIVESMEQSEWGKCDNEQIKDFSQNLDRFTKELVESMKSLTSGIELRQPDAQYELNKDLPVDVLSKKINDHPDLLSHIEDLFKKWLETIEKVCDDNIEKSNNTEAGPRTELDYWRGRMQKLTSVIEQLKRKDINNVIRIISVFSKPTNESYMFQSQKIDRESLAR